MAIENETCANCGRVIGKLESPFLWRESIVCQECHGRLSLPQPVLEALPREAYLETIDYSDGRRMAAGPVSPLPFRDNLAAPRWISLIGAVVCSFAGAGQLGGLLFLIWIVLGITHLIKKSNWKDRNPDG